METGSEAHEPEKRAEARELEMRADARADGDVCEAPDGRAPPWIVRGTRGAPTSLQAEVALDADPRWCSSLAHACWRRLRRARSRRKRELPRRGRASPSGGWSSRALEWEGGEKSAEGAGPRPRPQRRKTWRASPRGDAVRRCCATAREADMRRAVKMPAGTRRRARRARSMAITRGRWRSGIEPLRVRYDLARRAPPPGNTSGGLTQPRPARAALSRQRDTTIEPKTCAR